MEEKGKGKSVGVWRWIVVIVLIAVMLLCLVRCTDGCGANGNVSATGNVSGTTATTPVVTTQPFEETTAPTEANTTPTEPEATNDNTTPALDETLPQESTPPTTEVAPSDPVVNEPTHAHNYSATNTVSPTCTAQGYTTFACSCGSSYQSNVTQATGHSWGAWTITNEATTSAAGEQTRTCAKCGAAESQAIAQLPVEETTKPVACEHNWDTKYFPETGHYGESYIMCVCGHKCQTQEQWLDHVKSIGGADSVLYHASWSIGSDYIVDSPEHYEWVCSKCGVVSNTQP